MQTPQRRHYLTHRLHAPVDPSRLFAQLCEQYEDAFWLDGGPEGNSVIGTGERVVGAGVIQQIVNEVGPFGAAGDVDQPDSRLGFVGWVPYAYRSATLGTAPHDDDGHNPTFLRVERAIVIDERTGCAHLQAIGESWTGRNARWRDSTIALIYAPADSQSRRTPAAVAEHSAQVQWRDSRQQYLAKIADCQREIADGNAYVLCLTTMAHSVGAWDAIATYSALRVSNASHHGGVLRIGETTLVSTSPERFIEISRDGRIATHPVKGTRARSHDAVIDRALANELANSEKERAENVMIVDLMRNDLSRVCESGTVAVTRLFDIESYATVHQLVSTVTGILQRSVTLRDVLGALFPAGSMTGAPKKSAVDILNRIEHGDRGLYSGTFGRIGFDGRVDLAMIIRSIIFDGHGATVGTGGGITALSDPEAEYAETRLKVESLLRCLKPPADR